MIGLALIFIIGGFLWVAKKVVFAALDANTWLGFGVLAFFILMPTADAVIGRRVLHSRCEQAGSIRILEHVSDVEGVRILQGFSGPGVDEKSPQHYGYRFVESPRDRSRGALVDRATRDSTGATTIEKGVRPLARYELDVEELMEDGPYFFTKHVAIRDTSTDREIASFDWTKFRGGWAESFIDQFSDAGPPATVASCSKTSNEYDRAFQMLHQTLIAKKAAN